MLIQRLGSLQQKNKKYINNFIKIVNKNPNSCDEVWLSSEYGYPSIDAINKNINDLKPIIKLFKENNIKVSIQISNTIGHGQYISSNDCSGLIFENSPVENLVDINGKKADYCFCWNGPNFKEYISNYIAKYACLLPDNIWFDDDLRIFIHDPVKFGCFCNDCIKKFNQQYGFNYSRYKLAEEITYGNITVREKFIKFTRNNFGDFVYYISKTINNISKNINVCVEHGILASYSGYNYDFIFDNIIKATNLPPKSRPGGGAYNDFNPNDFLLKAVGISWQNSMLPNYVKVRCPEIENLPDVVFGKTIAGTCFESSLYFAFGNTEMSYAMLMRSNEPLSWHSKMLKEFSKQRQYWEMLVKINPNTFQAGIKVFLSKNYYKSEIKKTENLNKLLDDPIFNCVPMLRTAIPFSYDNKEENIFILHYENASRISNEEIEFLMSKPVITDGLSLKILNDRGYSFGAYAIELSNEENGKLFEVYENHIINKGFINKTWSQSFYQNIKHRIIDIDGETEVFGYFSTKSKNAKIQSGKYPYGICNAIINTNKGCKWAVFGHNVWNNAISMNKRNQILRVAEYISNTKLPAILLSQQQAILLPRKNNNGEVECVSIVNTTIGNSGKLKIIIRNPKTINFLFVAQYTKQTNISFSKKDEDYLLEIPNIKPWSVATIFCNS